MCKYWNDVKIDKYPVDATYVEPEVTKKLTDTDLFIDQEWSANHIRGSQYLLQITKCRSRDCCSSPRSNIFDILQNQFLPPPMKVMQTFERGIYPAKPDEKGAKFLPLLARLSLKIQPNAPGFSKEIPYDFYCPTVHPKLSERTCFICGLNFATKKAVKQHCDFVHKKELPPESCSRVQPVKIIQHRNREALCIIGKDDEAEVEWINIENLESPDITDTTEQNDNNVESDNFPIIEKLDEWLQSPWTASDTSDSNII